MYHREEPPPLGRTVPTHVKPFGVNNDVPLEGGLEADVKQLRLYKAGGKNHLRSENFKKELRESYPAEGTSPPPMPEQWQNMVEITQFMWKHGDIPREIGWKILVLIPKGKTDTRGIGLLESL